jgi:selenocysteine lyase/cysteine desulfurase
MHYARDSLLKSFGTSTLTYCVLPTGGGSTGAIEKAVHFLKGLEIHGQNWSNPTIFLTPYEHHSNILPWV